MTPELEEKIRAEFEQAMEDWLAHDDWQFADREAAWKFFFLAGRASVLDELEQVGWQHDSTARYDMIHTEVKELLARSGGHLLRPLDKTEHYTIPLYRLPPELQEEKEK